MKGKINVPVAGRSENERERICASVSYDPKTGVFTRLVSAGPGKAGMVAGTILNNGYRSIIVAGGPRLAHRLAWFLTCGEWPTTDIDHVNGNRDDNRIENLRLSTRAQNNANSKLHCTNTSGYRGIYLDRRRGHWVACISIKDRNVYIGSFPSKELAAEAYAKRALEVHGEFSAVSRMPS